MCIRMHVLSTPRRGPHVTQPRRIPVEEHDPRLRVREGSPLDTDALSDALAGHHAVVSALGLPARQALRPSTFMAECAAVTVAAMDRADVRRLAILSAAVLFPWRGFQFAFFSWILRHRARDLVAMETIVRASHLAWTIARPPRLVHADDTRYREATDAAHVGKWWA